METIEPRRILLLGIGPLPWENTTKIHGSCYRTFQFLEPLFKDGHQVRLVAMRITGLEERFDKEHKITDGRLTYYSVDEVECFRNDAYLQRHVDEFVPDCIIGSNIFPSSRACQLSTTAPIWADVNGYSMGEAQTKAFAERNDFFVAHNWHQQRPSLERADKFSSASDLQRHIVVGELGTVGRLNQYTMGYNFVHTVPEGRPQEPFSPFGHGPRAKGSFSPDDLLVLWSGGYNLWCDVETLFYGLEHAMKEDPRVHFVSTGGVIDCVDEKSYPRLQYLVSQSSLKDHFHLNGWIPSEQVPDYFLECDLGINVDRPCYEAVYGARNRITDMMKAGMPILTTPGTEISRLVEDARCGLTFSMGDPEKLASQLVYAASHRDELKSMGQRGQEYFRKNYTFEETTKPLRQWASSPCHAPDWDKPKPLQEPPPPPQAPPTPQPRGLRKWLKDHL